MADGAAITTDSNPNTPASMSDQEVNLLNEIAKIFGKFFELLFAIIALMNTDMGNSLLMTHHKVMMALVCVIVVYFLTWILVTMLQLHIRNFLPILVILLLGSAVSVVSLMMISFTFAWIALAIWLFIFALIGYYNHQELYEMIPAKVKNLIAGCDTVNPHNPELQETQSDDNTQSPHLPQV